MNKRLFHLLTFAAALVLFATVICLASALTQNRGMNHISGAWVGLAVDVADGVFYRPLISESGYGGTRFMPLQFLLHGALIKAGGHPVPTGHALSLLSMIALMGGIYCLLCWMGVGRGLAGLCAVLVLFSAVVQLALWTIRGDLLAAALNIWGLALTARALGDNTRCKHSVWLAALFLVLAFTAKLTTIFGFVAAVTTFFLSGQRKIAYKLGLLTFAGMALAVGLIHIASDGRALETMRACSSGGATLKDVAISPITWFRIAQGADPWSLVLMALAGFVLLLIPKDAWREIPSLALLTTAGVTVFLFGSPGVDYNHLLDLHVIALVFFAVQLARLRLDVSLGVITLAMVAMMGSANILFRMRSTASGIPRQDVVRTLEQVSNSGGPILSENPWYPILKDERPYMLDPFMFRLISRKNPANAHDLSEKLEQHFFRAVILQNDPQTEAGKYELDEVHFGRGFAEKLLESYELWSRQGMLLLYRPRG